MSRIPLLRPLLSLPVLSFMLLLVAATSWAQVPPPLGKPAPDFKLQDQNGQWHTPADYRGKWVALYFYPKDQTPGCTTQACEFRDNIFAFKEANAVIVGISVDDVKSHDAFAKKHSLPFTILADPTKETAKKYGVLKSYLGAMELASRDTFILDPEGRIVKHYADVDPKGHSQEVLKDIKGFQKKGG